MTVLVCQTMGMSWNRMLLKLDKYYVELKLIKLLEKGDELNSQFSK